MNRAALATVAVIAAWNLTSAAAAQQIIYVDASLSTGMNDGTSWQNAHQGRLGLRDALANVRKRGAGDVQIWVADGTYAPAAAGGSRDSHFALRNNLVIYGGFAGGETALEQRDISTNVSILTGDLNNNDAPGQIYWSNQLDNATNVVRAIGVDSSAVLDGVVVEHGAAAYVGAVNSEGGNLRIVSGSPVVRNCTFRFGYAEWGGGGSATLGGSPHFEDCTWFKNIGSFFGAGAYNTAGGTSIFDRCNFEQNVCGFGGGICNRNDGSTPTVIARDCAFLDNIGTISAASGIGIRDEHGELFVERCVFRNNKTDAGGGGIFLFGSHARVRNCDFVDNEALGDGGGAIYAQGMSFRGAAELTGEFVNCRFVGNNGVIVAVQAALVDFINCTMAHNSLQDQFLIWPVVFVQGPDATVRFLNNIIWGNGVDAFAQGGVVGGTGFTILSGNIEMHSSCVEHWDNSVPGNNNFELDPQFVNALGVDGVPGTVDDDVRVMHDSPCVDAGDNAVVPLDVTTDLDEHPRIIDGDANGTAIVDLGAYETLRPGDLNADGAVDVFDLFILLGNWGTTGNGASLASPTNVVDVFDLFVLLANWGG